MLRTNLQYFRLFGSQDHLVFLQKVIEVGERFDKMHEISINTSIEKASGFIRDLYLKDQKALQKVFPELNRLVLNNLNSMEFLSEQSIHYLDEKSARPQISKTSKPGVYVFTIEDSFDFITSEGAFRVHLKNHQRFVTSKLLANRIGTVLFDPDIMLEISTQIDSIQKLSEVSYETDGVAIEVPMQNIYSLDLIFSGKNLIGEGK